MIQFNLLPDVKLEYIKAQRTRRLVVSVSFLVAGASLALLILLIGVGQLQKKHLNDLSNDIKQESSELKNQPQISRILTVQNQLESLTDLHSKKPAASRLFDYLNQLTPATVSITNFNTDFTQQTATITGTADALSSVNKYVDTLKFTTFVTKDNPDGQKAFSDVVMSSFGLAADSSDGKPANYTITLSYDPAIFDITQSVTLKVPELTTTRSALQQSDLTDLFQQSTSTPKEKN